MLFLDADSVFVHNEFAFRTEDHANTPLQHLKIRGSCTMTSIASSGDTERFLVSFMVDARGGNMRGCRHSGVRVIIPPQKASMPMRITARYLKKERLLDPPPLIQGEAIASQVLELSPAGEKFLGPVMIEVPHFAALPGKEREIIILRSDNGETWTEHTMEATEDAVQKVLHEMHDYDEEAAALEDSSMNRTMRILTTDFPKYFAIVSIVRQEVTTIGSKGSVVHSSVVPKVQATFPEGALTEEIKVILQAQPIPAEVTGKLFGNGVAVSPIVTLEPLRRKFHKPISLRIPVPTVGQEVMNGGQCTSNDNKTSNLRLLCSITGYDSTEAQWRDVTDMIKLEFDADDCVTFTTAVSARFWLIDCPQIKEVSRLATELYKEASQVPLMAN